MRLYKMNRQIMYAKVEHTGYHPRLKTAGTVPKYLIVATGYSDLSLSSHYNTNYQTIIQVSIDYFPYIIEDKDWYWNPVTSTIQDEPPE